MQFADLYNYIVYPLLFILPAYIANGAPVLFGGGAPLDMGKRFRRRRIFGDNKTIRGTAFMMVGAIVVGLAEYPILHFMVYISILLGIGTIAGDLLGSFIKRQMRMNPGRSLPIMDQYGFFIFAILSGITSSMYRSTTMTSYRSSHFNRYEYASPMNILELSLFGRKL